MVPFQIRFLYKGKVYTASALKSTVNNQPLYTVTVPKELSKEPLQIDTATIYKKFLAMALSPLNLPDAVGMEILGKEMVDRN